MLEQRTLKQESGPGGKEGRSRPAVSSIGLQRRPAAGTPARRVPDPPCSRANPLGILKPPSSAGSAIHRRGVCRPKGSRIPTLTRRTQVEGGAARHPGKRVTWEKAGAEVSRRGRLYQVHVQQTCVWDGIARLNEEILLTMLDIYERHESEDPEARRLRTVKNIADLRQNLEETMSSLRGTQITHSTLETTFDGSVTTEISGRGVLSMASRPTPLSWRLGQTSPRLQAGDAPSMGNGYPPRANASRFVSSESGRYLYSGPLRRQLAARGSAVCSPELTDKVEELDLEGMGVDAPGYMSDGDVLSKNIRASDVTSGYMTDGGLSLYTRRLNRLPDGVASVREALQRKASTGQGDADSDGDETSPSSSAAGTELSLKPKARTRPVRPQRTDNLHALTLPRERFSKQGRDILSPLTSPALAFHFERERETRVGRRAGVSGKRTRPYCTYRRARARPKRPSAAQPASPRSTGKEEPRAARLLPAFPQHNALHSARCHRALSQAPIVVRSDCAFVWCLCLRFPIHAAPRYPLNRSEADSDVSRYTCGALRLQGSCCQAPAPRNTKRALSGPDPPRVGALTRSRFSTSQVNCVRGSGYRLGGDRLQAFTRSGSSQSEADAAAEETAEATPCRGTMYLLSSLYIFLTANLPDQLRPFLSRGRLRESDLPRHSAGYHGARL
ncbi:hypothetical protein SKAU_G00351930 [Synaphobranchus kaupii]|uniref:Uncharacterized protein n=1 Tax=Synaphobranchus kaupii TaxID=118154 RepID=A0A9Q1IHB6_SYNKA|nr:hypothetical protein SKAU_G00351930 [Synaphobranchus kaupii]